MLVKFTKEVFFCEKNGHETEKSFFKLSFFAFFSAKNVRDELIAVSVL